MSTSILCRTACVMVLAGHVLLGQAAGQTVPAAEHHLHIRSAAAAEFLKARHDAPPPGPDGPLTADDVIEALDAAGIGRGLVLSVAYQLAAPGVASSNEYERVQAENDYVAEQVARYPDRLVGACSLNPLSSYAFDEIERCAADERLGAVKLHLTNSEVDLRNPRHVERLASIFRGLGRLELPVVIHMRTLRDDYGAEDARILVDAVLSHAPRLHVQIAHMAGWGGYDAATDAALGAFVTALEDGRLQPDRISFGLGAVVFDPRAAGADTALARSVREVNQMLAQRIRRLGTNNVVFATDWPSWPPVPDLTTRLGRQADLLRQALPLTSQELDQVFSNVSPILR